MSRLEKPIETDIRLALIAEGVMVMKHHVDHRSPFGRGLGRGVADLICVVPPYGRLLAIEVKKADGRTSKAQKHWLAEARKHGALVGVARSVDDAMVLLQAARMPP